MQIILRLAFSILNVLVHDDNRRLRERLGRSGVLRARNRNNLLLLIVLQGGNRAQNVHTVVIAEHALCLDGRVRRVRSFTILRQLLMLALGIAPLLPHIIIGISLIITVIMEEAHTLRSSGAKGLGGAEHTKDESKAPRGSYLFRQPWCTPMNNSGKRWIPVDNGG